MQYKVGKIYLFNLFWNHIQNDFGKITDRTKLDYFKRTSFHTLTTRRQNSHPV